MKIQTLQKRGNSYGINIPKTYMKSLGWVPNEYVAIGVEDGKIIVQRLATVQVLPLTSHIDRGALVDNEA
jgi:antitoxin component of MazEF toxin-antitoxin module